MDIMRIIKKVPVNNSLIMQMFQSQYDLRQIKTEIKNLKLYLLYIIILKLIEFSLQNLLSFLTIKQNNVYFTIFNAIKTYKRINYIMYLILIH